ncbi:MAG: tetratricopeptide repeat protein [bacterium]|nr:tetratricopeptide repeat protein [bacterium]
MNLKCTKCGTLIEFAREITTTPDARVVCPRCHARYRLKPRKTILPGQTSASPASPALVTTPSPSATASSGTAPQHPPTAGAADRFSRLPTSTPTTPLPPPTAGAGGEPGGAVFSAGEVLANRYRIVRFIAQGGMGEVYEAEDLELHERVALKTISAQQGADETVVERFKREIHLARKVTHPNVCRIFDLGQHHPETGAGTPPAPAVTFLTMELLEGETLIDRLRRSKRLSTEEALPLARQIAAGLGAAHKAQVVHRDLKSENIYLVRDGDKTRTVVTDFGIARGAGGDDRFAALVTGAGIVGTPAYMAPEQVEGGEVTVAADVYAFGVVLYEMVTGRLPFESDNPLTTAVKRLKEPPPPPHIHVPDLDVKWEKTILRCLARAPGDRFATVEEAAEALAAKPVRPPRSPAVTPPAPAPAAARAPRQRRLLIEVALLAVLTLVAVLYYALREEELDRSRIVPRRSVAVLGFSNQQTGQTDLAWMSTALAEMLSTELARGEVLRTIPGERVARMEQELEAAEIETVSGDDIQRVRSLLGCDFVVRGSFLSIGSGEGQKLRLDLELDDAALGKNLSRLSTDGSASDLFELVKDLGAQVREKLDVGKAGGDEALAGLPTNREAARLYSEALDSLRESQPRAARDLLQEAVRAEPGNPLIHSALSTAWEALGYGARAAEEAQRAFDLCSQLPREDRLAVEGRFREVQQDWPAAIEIYKTLWEYFPDNLEYGLRLAAVETSARLPAAVLSTIGEIRQLPAPTSEDPRIDLAEAAAAGMVADYERQLEAATRGAERAAEQGASLLVAQARLVQSQAQRFLGRPKDAAAAASEALEIHTEISNPDGRALALITLANAHFDRARFDEAIARCGEAVEVYRDIGNQGGTASGLNNLAMVHKRKGDLDRAQPLYEEAERIYKETGDQLAMANTINNLGGLLVSLGELAQAKARFERAHAIWEESEDRSGTAYALNNIAAVLRLQGELKQSRTLQEEALEIRRAIDQKSGVVFSLSNLGGVLCDLGELGKAGPLLTEGRQLAEAMGHRSALAQSLFELGELGRAQGNLSAALTFHQKALELRRELEERHTIAESRIAIARMHLEMGDPAAAEAEAERAISDCQRDHRTPEQARATAIRALALLAQGRLPEASDEILAAALLAASSEQQAIRFEVTLAQARVDAATGKRDQALRSLREIEEEVARAGYAGLALDTVLTGAEIELAHGGGSEFRDRLGTVESRAAAQGFTELRTRAEEALRATGARSSS